MIKAHCKGIQGYTVYPGSAGIFKYDMIIYEDSRTSPKSSEDVRSLLKSSEIRDREEGIVIYSFYTWFSFLQHGSYLTYFCTLCQARRQQLTFFNQV